MNYLTDALPAKLPDVRIEVLDTYGPGTFWLMPLFFFTAAARLIVRRASGRADLLHIHMAARGSAVRKTALAALAAAMRLPTVMHLHGSVFDDYFRALPPWRKRLLSRILQKCARVIVVGTHWRDFAIREVGLHPDRVVLVHNGVPVGPLPRGVTRETPALLMLGQLGARKGTPELLAALASPDLRAKAWTATLAGDGPVEQFRAIVSLVGLTNRVSIPGWQAAEQARALLSSADIFVLPSHDEGLPMAILEAMAAGVTVVATPVGAIPDAIVEGETGLLVPPGDISELARAIAMLLDDVTLRKRLASNARVRCELMFSIDRTAECVAAIYRELGVT